MNQLKTIEQKVQDEFVWLLKKALLRLALWLVGKLKQANQYPFYEFALRLK